MTKMFFGKGFMHDAMPVAEIIRTLQYDHERMREIGARILSAIGKCDVNCACGDLLEFQLVQDSHFWFQNRLMEAADYPDMEEHVRCHERLHNILIAVNGALCSGRYSTLTDELAAFIEEALAHITEMDEPFHDYLIAEKS
jgi:hemerythrin